MEKKLLKTIVRTGLALMVSMLCHLAFDPNCHAQSSDELQEVERLHYENACKTGTIEDLKEYLEIYPEGTYVEDVNNRIADYNLWDSARKTNNISAYENYINVSTYKSYVSQAEDAIVELESQDTWNAIKNDGSRTDVEQFTRDYPKSSCLDAAKKRIHEFNAVDAYNRQDYKIAKKEFDEAGGLGNLRPENRIMYNNCVQIINEANAYARLNASSSQTELKSFLDNYPKSDHYNQVSNWLALSKARSLNAYSSNFDANSALSYAKDDATRKAVNSNIDRMNKAKTSLRRQQRRNNVMNNGGYVNFGIEYLDLGVDMGFTDVYYKVGGCVRLGNYASPVQFEVGVKPGLLLEYDGYYDDYDVRFIMPIYAKLKVNLCELNYRTKLFVAGLGSYDPFRNRYYEDNFACGGGIGIAKRHMDMLLYYKQDVRNCDNYNRYLAFSMAYYF